MGRLLLGAESNPDLQGAERKAPQREITKGEETQGRYPVKPAFGNQASILEASLELDNTTISSTFPKCSWMQVL